jgi:hypothetical protein
MGRQWSQKQMSREGIELEELEQQLAKGRGKCPSCVAEGIVANDHSLYRCQHPSSEQSRAFYAQKKNAIRQGQTMAKFSGCMGCFLPQAWCNQWEQSERRAGMYQRKKGGWCAFEDVVLSGVVVGLRRVEVRRGMQQRMASAGFDMRKAGDMEKYWGQRRCWGTLETSVLLQEFYLMGREEG